MDENNKRFLEAIKFWFHFINYAELVEMIIDCKNSNDKCSNILLLSQMIFLLKTAPLDLTYKEIIDLRRNMTQKEFKERKLIRSVTSIKENYMY